MAVADQANLERWNKTAINLELLTSWIDYCVADRWGVQSATRVFFIATTGHDVKTFPFGKKSLPSEKPIIIGNVVPGSSSPAQTVYDVSQVLSWLAGQRRCVEEQLNWQRDIPGLVTALINGE